MFHCAISSLIRPPVTSNDFSSAVNFPRWLQESLYEQQSHILTQQAQNVSFPLSPLFPRGKHSVNIPLSCSVGDYKSKLQLYRDRRGHPGNPQPSPPSLPPFRYLLSSFRLFLPSRLITLLHKCIQPLMASPGSCVCDLPLLVSLCKDKADTAHANQQHDVCPT